MTAPWRGLAAAAIATATALAAPPALAHTFAHLFGGGAAFFSGYNTIAIRIDPVKHGQATLDEGVAGNLARALGGVTATAFAPGLGAGAVAHALDARLLGRRRVLRVQNAIVIAVTVVELGAEKLYEISTLQILVRSAGRQAQHAGAPDGAARLAPTALGALSRAMLISGEDGGFYGAGGTSGEGERGHRGQELDFHQFYLSWRGSQPPHDR